MNKNRITSSLQSFFIFLFGQIHWKKPLWLSRFSQRAKAAPGRVFGSVLGLIALLIAGGFALHWYLHLPKPILTTAVISVPGITANDSEYQPQPLIVNFGIQNNEFMAKPVAPIDKIGKFVTEGVTLSPSIKGQWTWNTDSQLIFTPNEDWPADQIFTLQFTKDFFTPKTKMDGLKFSFSTQAFKATITEFKFYQDPIDSEKRYAVATMQFNFPVDPTSLEQNTQVFFQSTNKNKASPIKFTITYDEHKRIAYLHTEVIKIEKEARYVQITLDKDIRSSSKAPLQEAVSKNVLIPDSSNFLRIAAAKASIIRNDKDRPEQVLTIETTLGVKENEFNKSVHFYLLPEEYPATSTEKAKPNYSWQNPGEVTEAILALATPLSKENIPTNQNYSSLHSYKFSAHTPRYLYIKVDKGMKGFGGFTLTTDYANILAVPELPKEISFLHKGSLLALSGEKKFSVLVRGVPAVKFDFARVLPNNINQLITQTQGDFNNPYFINPTFSKQNISQITSDIRQFDTTDLSKQQYTALDLGPYLKNDANGSGPQGLFLLQATGWDVANKSPLDVTASRLILITDLGLLVKDNKDGSHDVFVQSITKGTAVEQVKVSVLGKNGLEIISRLTDSQGRANFPSLKDFMDEKEPTVYLAALNNDVSFIPFKNENRNLNFSKFDIGGLYTSNPELNNLTAFLFSDRGLYRPGDMVHIGMIVKQAYAQHQPAGLPLQATVRDPRGTVLKTEKILLNESGYMNLDFKTQSESPTGTYSVDLTLMKDDLPQNLLGSVNVKVAEFQPDRMRIQSSFLPKPAEGWSSPAGLKAQVTLMNLYGAPGTDRRLSAKILLDPIAIEFSDYPDYVFADPLQDPKKPAKIYSESLKDVKTNDKGEAEFNLNLDKFEKASYELTFFVEGFESEGGRSVSTQSKTIISPLSFFVGYKPDGDLTFIKQNAHREIQYLAVNPQLDKEEIKELRIQLTSLRPVSSLVKNSDGTYQYQSIIQSSIVSTQPFTISAQGTAFTLPTQNIGDYSLAVLGKDDTLLSQLKFSVVGTGQTPLAKNAELSITLNKTVFNPNEEIEIQLTAPYTGSGLITIERDKVYATQWFKTDTTSSIQRIRVPADFQGNGYINVAFVRNWESPELFMSPLSYSVAPFEVNHENHEVKIHLKTPKISRPGEPFTIEYATDKPANIIVFAVDEGILQVSRFETPDPLAFFFQKYALEVATQQTVDQILPQFIQSRELSAAGGDGSEDSLAGRLNPFKRKTDLPVAFWSGILEASESPKEVSYQVPDYFNGTLKVMAVAVAKDAVGKQDSSAQIRGDFILNPNVPTFVAPGDSFEISSSIANNVKDSGEHTQVTVELTTSPGLELIGDAKQTLEIGEGHEQTVHYKLRATAQLGSAEVIFRATASNKTSAMKSTLSIRPATPLMTFITSGLSKESKQNLNLIQTLYPEERSAYATLSTSPLILLYGLDRYLANFPYGCTEQLTSKAMPLLAMSSTDAFNKNNQEITEKINAAIQMLGQRQMSNGGFSYWPGLGENANNTFASVYAMHFLTEAKKQGFSVSDDLFYNGISYLKEFAGQNPVDFNAARTQAYAIYVLTSNEIITTNYLANLQSYLQQTAFKQWEKDITGAYIASSYHLLKSYEVANDLIKQYDLNQNKRLTTDFFNGPTSNAQYLYLVASYFPNQLKKIGDTLVLQLVQAMNNEEINTIFSGFTSMALSAYQKSNIDGAKANLSITETMLDNKTNTQPVDHASYQKRELANTVKQITFNNPDKLPYFYQLVQTGFDKKLPEKPIKQGIEIFREYKNLQGKVISTVQLGDEIEVFIQIRALDADYLNNIAIEDLLPGGFEVVKNSVKSEYMEYFDIREDRVNFFGSIDSTMKTLRYKIKAVNTGIYKIPPAFAEAMYNPTTRAVGLASEITVTKRPNV